MEDQTITRRDEADGPREFHEAELTLIEAIRKRLREMLRSRISLAIFLGLTAVAVVAEPFDTDDALPFFPRIIYWAIVVGVSIAAGAISDEVSHRTTRPANWRAPVKAAALMGLGYAPFVVLISNVFNAFGASLQSYPPKVFFYVLVVSITVFAVIHVLRPHLKSTFRETGASSVEDAALAEPEFADTDSVTARLAARLSDPHVAIYRVSANDHMTEVATSDGIERIRMRFADAVLEMEPVAGVCVHRSHWVALDAVVGLIRRERKPFVQLVNGEELPVSRTYRPRLEEAMPDLF